MLEDARALGVDLADLIAADTTSIAEPLTVAAWAMQVDALFTPPTAATYRPYWRLATELLGDRPVGLVTAVELAGVVEIAVARQRRPDVTGRGSREACITALRALFAKAVAAGHTTTNPAAALSKPRRTRGRRRALTDRELDELIDAICTTSPDPDLDLLLVRFHLETGARRQRALQLRVRDLDPARATIWLDEKNDAIREQPVSPSLVAALEHHAATRAATGADEPVLHNQQGRSISGRHYDALFARARSCLGWADRTPVSSHVLRHTAVTAIGRIAGYPVAQAFAGHAPPTVTGRYLHATVSEVADAVAVLTGEPHPLATDRPADPGVVAPRRSHRSTPNPRRTDMGRVW